ncbi:MAG: hypothetical protein F6K26_35045 [Moorea sp. SIO2I5]|nr:hypothetical protein [Moorena sp. SIO2I5]
MSTYRVWRRICLRDFPQYQDSHHTRQIIYKTSAFFIVASTLILLPCIASAQSSPPPGVNIPPNTPEIIDQTLPQPTPSPSAARQKYLSSC